MVGDWLISSAGELLNKLGSVGVNVESTPMFDSAPDKGKFFVMLRRENGSASGYGNTPCEALNEAVKRAQEIGWLSGNWETSSES